jgi:DNA recombination protein RmuC
MEEKYILLIIGLIVGGGVAFLWVKQKYAAKNAILQTNLDNAINELANHNSEVSGLNNQIETLKATNNVNERDNVTKDVTINGLNKELEKLQEQFEKLTKDFNAKTDDFNAVNKHLATAQANNVALQEKLSTQKTEIEKLGEKFNTEFENIASKILKSNTISFSELNESKIKELLNPLGENIKEFKTKVQEVYDKEAKERFSLGEKVKELAEKSDQISKDAINLTNALKGEAKTQGNWGEMILESILEKSGLRKDEEYFMEHQLNDENGKPLRSDSEGKKMRPDAVIKYPDNRNVIIDSKVSLNAFSRFIAATDVKEQKKELEAHISAIKNHIITLSTKGYDDYDKALDFVMMFIPSEPAYIAAMQGDSNLWNYAYDKRILLMNPTNLITSLKLIVDLWKREYQNQNAIEIASRGAKLFDKFTGFVENLEKVGKHLDNAKTSYDNAHSQLKTGNDNLVLQANKLKELGVKNKKELSKNLVQEAQTNILTD